MKCGVEKIFDETDTEIYNQFMAKEVDEFKVIELEEKGKLIDKRLITVSNKQEQRMHNHLQ